MSRILRILSFIVVMAVVDGAIAQTATTSAGATTATTKTQKKATLNFEDELIEGSTQKPDLAYLFQKKNFNYKRLIKLRENFLPEMRRTTEDIQRVRGGN